MGPFWPTVYALFEIAGDKYSKDSFFDKDACVPILKIIADVHNSHGSEKLMNISHSRHSLRTLGSCIEPNVISPAGKKSN